MCVAAWWVNEENSSLVMEVVRVGPHMLITVHTPLPTQDEIRHARQPTQEPSHLTSTMTMLPSYYFHVNSSLTPFHPSKRGHLPFS